MKKIVFLLIVLAAYSVNGIAQQETAASCFESYKGQLAKGYNALAIAMDNGFFVCGYAFGSLNKKSAAQKSLEECEINRLNPANEVEGVRKVMTHCRIYDSQLME